MDLKDLAGKFLPIVKDLGAHVWDGPEDTEFLKFIAEDSAKLALQAATGADVATEFEVLKEAVRQRAAQKAIRINGLQEETFFKILDVVIKIAKAFI